MTRAEGRRNRVKIAASLAPGDDARRSDIPYGGMVQTGEAMMVGYHANKDALHLRLRRIEGHVPGIPADGRGLTEREKVRTLPNHNVVIPVCGSERVR